MARHSRCCFAIVVMASGCGDLADRPVIDSKAGPDVRLQADPPVVDGRVVPVVHFYLSGLPSGLEPAPLMIVGQATDRNLRDLAEGDLGTTLLERIVATSAWRLEDGRWITVPHGPLAPGDRYSLVVPSLRWAQTVDVTDHDDMPVLTRMWPPKQSTGQLVVWCLEWPPAGTVPSAARPFEMIPGVSGWLDWGVFEGSGSGCVHWRPEQSETAVVVPPPLVRLADGREARVDPAPVGLEPGNAAFASTGCGAAEVALGPCCAEVLDDRAVITTRNASWLLDVEIGERRWTATVALERPWVLRPLVPEARHEGTARVVSAAGRTEGYEISWTTSPSSPHVIINEVMANPAGPEPQQEWVELYNDGTGEVSLQGWRLEDAGGATELPAVTLQPGEYALVVSSGYDPASWVDAPPAPGAKLIRVDSVGTSGLSNAGEPVRLVRGDGETASRVPAIVSKEQGWSVARTSPEGLDMLSSSFAFGPDGGTPGGPNEGWSEQK